MPYGSFRGGGGGFRRGGFKRDFGPREMTKIKCSECGKEDEVPFKPREGTSVLCKECYAKKRGFTPRPREEESEESETEEVKESEEAKESEDTEEKSETEDKEEESEEEPAEK